MPRYTDSEKTRQYTIEFNTRALQLSLLAGLQVQEVVKTLDIHALMLF